MTWTELKGYLKNKSNLRYTEDTNTYDIWIEIDREKYNCEIYKNEASHDADKENFENEYKDSSNTLPASHPDEDSRGRWVIKTESRRRDWETIFAGIGDDLQGETEGRGTPFLFDFSVPVEDTRWITAPAGYKRQQINWQFLDPVNIKEGTIYFYDIPKGSYYDFYIVCPAGGYYYKKTYDPSTYEVIKTPTLATEDTIFTRWVCNYYMEGSAPMGDELNTEAAAEYSIPSYFIWRAEYTIPEVTDWELAHGHWTLELYKPRSVVL